MTALAWHGLLEFPCEHVVKFSLFLLVKWALAMDYNGHEEVGDRLAPRQCPSNVHLPKNIMGLVSKRCGCATRCTSAVSAAPQQSLAAHQSKLAQA